MIVSAENVLAENGWVRRNGRAETGPVTAERRKSGRPEVLSQRVPKISSDVHHETRGQKRLDPLKRNLYGHLLAGLLWKRQFGKVLLENGRERAPTKECLFVHRQQNFILSVYVHDIKMTRKKQNLKRV